MSAIIKDGTGTGNAAKVDDRHRLQTFTTTESGFRSAQKKGDAFFIGTDIITLTTDTESAILYLKSLEDSDIVIQSISLRVGSSTNGATTNLTRTDYTQPTTGTLISDEVPAVSLNLLASDITTFNGLTYQGSEGKTIGGEILSAETLQLTNNLDEDIANFIVPKGSALGLSITPPSGNTSMEVQVQVKIYLLDSE